MKKMLAIPFHKAHITDDEINAAADAMRSGWLTMGKVTVEFEEKFKEYVGSPQSVSVNSATSALHLALKAIGLKQDDEVIMPTTTFVATAEVVTYFGGRPVLCDIDRNTHNIDVLKIEALITDKTKAIIPVHFAGQPCDMDEIYEISNRYKLRVIEDAAHALPSHYKGDRIGSLKGTDVTCFSFYATKNLAIGEGGMILTKKASNARKLKILSLIFFLIAIWPMSSLIIVPSKSTKRGIELFKFIFFYKKMQTLLAVHFLKVLLYCLYNRT